jgi:hypothetical protein
MRAAGFTPNWRLGRILWKQRCKKHNAPEDTTIRFQGDYLLLLVHFTFSFLFKLSLAQYS